MSTSSLLNRSAVTKPEGTYRQGTKAAAASLAAACLVALFPSVAAANVSGIVDVTSGETLRVRSAPNSTATIVANLADNSAVSIICQVTGPNVVGNVSTTTQWDKLSNGYVSHAFIRSTGTIPACGTTTQPPATTTPQGRVTVAAGDTLKVRATPSTTAAQISALASGAIINLTCLTTGQSVNGNTSWYKVGSGYVSAAYVARTNSTTLPVCAPVTTPPPPSTSAVRAEFLRRANYWFEASNGRISGRTGFVRNPSSSQKEGPTGTSNYRTDCSGLIAMAWNLGSGNQPSSSYIGGSAYSRAINVNDMQPGDILTTTGHVTMFEKWTDSSKNAYWAYDFGGGGTGTVEHKTYTITKLSATTARRGNDSRIYTAYRSVKTG